MTKSTEKGFTMEDQALSHIITNCAKFGTSSLGPPVSDEELAVMLEGEPERILGAKRLQEINQQLATQPDLYQDWLCMLQDYEVEFGTKTAPADVPKATNTVVSSWDQWMAWLQDFFTPQVGFASAFSVAATFAFAWFLMPSGSNSILDPSSGSSVAVHQAQSLPEKATLSYKANTQTEAVVATALTETFACQGLVASVGEICYSRTEPLQHWFYVRKPDVMQALPPLVDAQKVVSVTTDSNFLLIEYTRGKYFNLALVNVREENGTLTTNVVYEDQAGSGYFDGVSLKDGELRYQIQGSEEVEAKHYRYEP